MGAGNWIALAGIVSGAVVAVTGSVVTFLLTREDRRHARRLARDERLFAARRQVYEDVLYAAARTMLWVERKHPMMSFGEDEPAPDPPDIEEGLRLHARVAAVGSGDVLDALDAMLRAAQVFSIDAAMLDAMEGRRYDADGLEVRIRLDERRQEVRDDLRRLEQLARDELTGLVHEAR